MNTANFSTHPTKANGPGPDRNRLSRRGLLRRAGIIGLTGLALPSWMPRMAFASEPSPERGDILVCIFQRGGMDGLSAVVPYNEAGYYDSRPGIRVPDRAVLDLDGQFGLHPSLAPLHEIWQQADLAVVQAVGSPDPTRSHFDAMDYMERGTPGEKQIQTGWIARHLQTAAWQNESPFRAVGMGAMLQASLRGPVPALALKSIADFHLQGRAEELASVQTTLAQLYGGGGHQSGTPIDGMLSQQADTTFAALGLLESADPAQHQPQNGAVYPEDEFGMALRQVVQLIRADVGLEIACIDVGGWDTHESMGPYDDGLMGGLLANLAAGLHAFYTDLAEEMGRISVVTMSEFGRRVQENGSGGTDHGHGNCMFLLGGGFRGGAVYGQWPGLAAQQLDRGDLAVTTDFRDVLAEVAQMRLGNPALADIFPDYAPQPLGLAHPRGQAETRNVFLPIAQRQ